MPWMRVAIGVGGAGLVAGLTGMVVWIDDGSHYFAVAVALGSAGFLTLVACALANVFGSSHGSQDDAFRRGQSMGYDSGFLEGHRTARPVVVPLRSLDREVDQDLAVPGGDIGHGDEPEAPPAAVPSWRREAMPAPPGGARSRVLAWVVARRMVLVAGVLVLGVIGVLAANASVPTPRSAEALLLTPHRPGSEALPPSGSIPGLVSSTGSSGWSVAVGAGGTLGMPGEAAVPAAVPGFAPAAVPGVVPAGAAAAQGVPVAGATAVRPVATVASQPAAGAAPAVFYSPAATRLVSAPAVASVAVAPVVDTRTIAQITADNAAAAAAQTARVAAASAALTAQTAASAAAQTAATAAAAAEAVKLQAAADAWAVAHPAG